MPTTAKGLTEDEAERIFEPGVRGSAAGADARGAGLGLALARRLVRTVGGEITAQAAPAGGTVQGAAAARMITNWLLGLPPLLVYLGLFGSSARSPPGCRLPGETSLIASSILASQHSGISIEVVIADRCARGDRRRQHRLRPRQACRPAAAHPRGAVDGAPPRVSRASGEAFFEKHGSRAVFLARWLPGLRVVGSWLAGAHHMRWRTFLLWNALGGIAWATSIGLAAYLSGTLP